MADSVLDFAGVEEAAASAADTTVADSEVEVTGTEAGAESGAAEGSEEVAEGAEGDKGAEKDGAAGEGKDDLPGSKSTPDSIRKALKALKTADPKSADAVKVLHGSYERWEAAKKVFPNGVAEMKAAKDFMTLVGGQEGYEQLSSTLEAVRASDEKLYSGDASLLEDIYEDLKSEGKTEAFGKLLTPFIDKVKAVDSDAYYAAFQPHFLAGIEEVNLNGALAGLVKALTLPEGAKPEDVTAALAKAKEIADGANNWYKNLKGKQEAAKTKQVDPERLKLDADRKDFEKKQNDFKTNQTKEFQTKVGAECETNNNQSLGKELKGYLKMPFFKGFPRETLMDLGNGIKQNLYARLKSDDLYQKQMKAFWGAKSPDQAKIVEYHKNKLDGIAAEVVRETIQKRYPGYARGGAAAGRVAAAATKKEETRKADAAATATGKPIYVPQKPDLKSIDWDKDPKQLLFITGKAHLTNGKYVTWKK